MKYSDNIAQVLSNIEGKLKKASDVSKLNRTIGTYLKASNLRRIHNEGLGVNGSPIGAYSVKPIYVNPKNSPRKFAPKGKTGRTFFITNKADRKKFESRYGIRVSGLMHRTKYFAAGYFGFRAAIGREVSVVNLQLSGKLLKDWLMEQQENAFIIGFRSRYGTKISEGNEKRFGKKIWGVSPADYKEIEGIKQEFIKEALA